MPKRDYKDRTQVEPYWDAYQARLQELQAAGRYPYNADFKGRIGAPEVDEDFLIYMLQKERSIREMEAQVAERIAAGYVAVESIPEGTTRCEAVAEYGFYVGGSGFREFRDVRLVRNGRTLFVLPKGRRTRGHAIGRSALVKVSAR